MLKTFYSRKAQAVSAEYVLTLMLAIGAVVSMSTYIKRAFQAKIYEVNFRSVKESARTLGNSLNLEYEPYYYVSATNSDTYERETTYLQRGVFDISVNNISSTSVNSAQLAPKDAY